MSNVKELQPDEVEVLLRKLFIMYASYGTRSNLQYLRSAKFQKLISDAGVLDPKLNKKQVDLIFYAVNKRDPNMTFERFLECLVKVSEIKFAGQTKDQALKRLLNEFILPLYSTSDQGDLDPDKSLFVDADAMDLLSSIFPILNDLYVNYFAWELTSSETHEVISERSQKAFHLFLRDFDICPTIISKSSAFALWCDLVVMERINPKIEAIIEPDYERGQCFTLTKFVMSIYLAAILGYQHDTSMADRPNIEKLLLILERMELSKGFMQIEKKTSRPHQAKTSLLPSKNVINRALNTPSSELSKADASVHSINETRINPTDITHLTSFQEEEGDDIAALELEENGLEALEKYLEQLQKIFTAYCSYGEPMNRTRLKSAKLMKMLKDCGLFRTAPGSANTSRASIRSTQSRLVSKVDVDLIFAKLTGNNQARQQLRRQSSFASRSHLSLANSNAVGRMEFQQFLKALEYIAEKVAPD